MAVLDRAVIESVPKSNATMRFDELLDITGICAVRIGDLEIPLY